jgi:hypothetical protein
MAATNPEMIDDVAEEVTGGPQVGERAPEFLIATASGRLPLGAVAARAGKLVLASQDSYRYHGT